MFTIEFRDLAVSFDPSKYEDFIKKSTKTALDNNGRAYTKREHQVGGNFRYFLFEFEMIEESIKEILETIYIKEPTLLESAKLHYEGNIYNVIFAPELGDNACKFTNGVLCKDDRQRYYPGQMGLRKIEEEL